MPSIRALYNDDLIHAHREAVATLRELLATEEDRTERRRLATTLLRARPVKVDAPLLSLASAAGEGGGGSATPGEGALRTAPTNATAPTHQDAPNVEHDDAVDEHDDLNDDYDHDLDNPNDPANRQIAALAHEAQHGPDHLGALSKLQEIMMGNFEALTPENGTAQAP